MQNNNTHTGAPKPGAGLIRIAARVTDKEAKAAAHIIRRLAAGVNARTRRYQSRGDIAKAARWNVAGDRMDWLAEQLPAIAAEMRRGEMFD